MYIIKMHIIKMYTIKMYIIQMTAHLEYLPAHLPVARIPGDPPQDEETLHGFGTQVVARHHQPEPLQTMSVQLARQTWWMG